MATSVRKSCRLQNVIVGEFVYLVEYGQKIEDGVGSRVFFFGNSGEPLLLSRHARVRVPPPLLLQLAPADDAMPIGRYVHRVLSEN